MKSVVLTPKEEYKSILYISIPILAILAICLIYLIYTNGDLKAILGCILLSFPLLYSMIDYVFFLRKKENYPTLIINSNGIHIHKGTINRTMSWKEIKKISFYLGKYRLDGLIMSISTVNKDKVVFSFFQYSIGLHPNKIIEAIKFFSGNNAIVEIQGIYKWIRKIL